jgi:hypothetical protein
MKLSRLAPAAALASVALCAAVVRAEIPRTGLQQDTLQTVLDRIHMHAGNDAWKQGGFQDDVIEKWLDKVVGSVAKAADFPELTLPVRLKDVKPKDAVQQPRAGRSLNSVLIIGRDIDLKDAILSKCVILADGNVSAPSAESCLIVARGAVTLSMSSSNSVIVSGIYVKLGQFDGRPNSAANGSLVISRGWVDAANTYGTMIAAPEGISMGRPHNATFINAPAPVAPAGFGFVGNAGEATSRSIKVPDLPLEALPVHPITSRIEITGVVHANVISMQVFSREQRAFGPSGIIFLYEGHTHVAEIGQPISDEAGNEVESLHGWRLGTVNGKFALLVGPDHNAVVRLEKKQ